MPSHHIKTISQSTFDTVLSRYAATVPSNLRDLDALRYDTIPAAVANRPVETRHLTKIEVEQLVEWKLYASPPTSSNPNSNPKSKHGTFRPQLLSLVSSNPTSEITSTTTSAFSLTSSPISALKTLIKLKGIGPATASLLLSVAKPDEIPFFSDELFRWCVWDESGTLERWKRKIKYNVKEYEKVLEGVEGLIERLGVRAVDVERVAWVLGREGVDVDADDENVKKPTHSEEEKEDISKIETKEPNETKEEDQSGEETEKQKVSKKGTKRKASVSKPPAEGTRKSTRTKK
jgi:hypothetical protein